MPWRAPARRAAACAATQPRTAPAAASSPGPASSPASERGGHRVVEPAEHVLQRRERLEIGSRALPGKQRGEELGDVAQASWRRSAPRAAPRSTRASRLAAMRDELAMAAREQLRRERGGAAAGRGSGTAESSAARSGAPNRGVAQASPVASNSCWKRGDATAARASLRATRRRAAARARSRADARRGASHRGRTRRRAAAASPSRTRPSRAPGPEPPASHLTSATTGSSVVAAPNARDQREARAQPPRSDAHLVNPFGIVVGNESRRVRGDLVQAPARDRRQRVGGRRVGRERRRRWRAPETARRAAARAAARSRAPPWIRSSPRAAGPRTARARGGTGWPRRRPRARSRSRRSARAACGPSRRGADLAEVDAELARSCRPGTRAGSSAARSRW